MRCSERHSIHRVVDVVILYATVGVDTPLRRDVDSCFSTLCALGGNEDDTVGTAGTVKCVGCGILQHRYVLDVSGVDVIPITVVRKSVKHDKRRG